MRSVTRFGLTAGAWRELERESVDLFRRLLRVDTTNPPGNETECALVLRDYFAAAGIEAEMVGESAHRQNLVARLQGRQSGPTLLLLGHMDVVPAEADQWTVPPFSAELHEGYVWGRGALDMKCQVAAHAVAFARLARDGADFAGQLIFAATADEERGEQCGARWLAQHRPDLVACDYLINEGGGSFVDRDGRRLYTFTTGEKGCAQFTVRTRGKGGHGSVPLHRLNAVETMGRVITALADHRLPATVDHQTVAYIDRLVDDRSLAARLKDPGQVRAALAEMHLAGDQRAFLIEPLVGITFSPTVARAGGPATNVIPAHADVTIDCRILPGQTAADVEREVRRALRDLGDTWELEIFDHIGGNASPAGTPLHASLERVLADMVPDADLLPTLLCGFTDSRWFREAFPDVVAYGFCPFFTEDAVTMGGREHAADERIPAADVPSQALFVERVVRDLLR